MIKESVESRKKEIAASKELSSWANWDFNWEGDDFKIADIHKLIIYQIHMVTFFGEKSGYGENLEDLDKKLAYLKVLGVNAMELVTEGFIPETHKGMYDLENPLNIKGSNYESKNFANLVKRAHSYGIAVIKVVDYNRFGAGDMNPWRFYDWPEHDKQDYFYEDQQFIPNFGRSEVRKFIRDYVFMWLEKYHCDGIRVKSTDFVGSITNTGNRRERENGLWLLKEINGEIRTKYPDKLLIAEDNGERKFIIEPLVSGGLGFNAQWDSLFMHNIRFVLKQVRDEDRTIQCIVDALVHSYGDSSFSRVIYCESDSGMEKGLTRLPEEIHPGGSDSPYAIKRSVLGAVLTLTAPGIPLLYQGQEFVTSSFFVIGEHPELDKLYNLQGIQQLFGDLIKLRKSDYKDYIGLQGNQLDFIHFNQKEKILAYQRSHPDYSNHRVVIIVNLSYKDYKKYVIGLPAAGRWKLVFNSSSKEYHPSGSSLSIKDFVTKEKPYDGHPFRGSFALPGYSALIFIHYTTDSMEQT